MTQPPGPPAPPPPPGWVRYHNAWYGVTLDHPEGWEARSVRGAITVTADSVTSATIRMFSLAAPASARQVADAVVARMRKVVPSLQASTDPEVRPAVGSDSVTLRSSANWQGAALEGIMNVKVDGTRALVSGFQAPSGQLPQAGGTLAAILASAVFNAPIELRRYQDSAENAFSGYAPSDWSVQAVLRRAQTPERMPLPEVVATDPGGVARLIVPPVLDTFTETPSPGWMPRLTRYMPFVGARQYAEQVCAAQLVQEHPGARFEGSAPLPEMNVLDREGVHFEGAIAAVSYPTAAGPVHEKVHLLVTRITAMRIWTVRFLTRRIAPRDSFPAFDAIFGGIADTYTPDPEWEAREAARAGQLFATQYMGMRAGQQAYLQSAQHLQHATQQAARSMIVHGHEARDAQLQFNEDHVLPILRGEQMMLDAAGNRYLAPISYGTYWVDAGRQRGWITPSYGDAPSAYAERLRPM